MHILYLQQLLVLPGASGNSRCWEFAQQWRQAGHKITFLTSSSGLPVEVLNEVNQRPGRVLTIEGIDIHVLPASYSHQMRFRRRILSFLQFYLKAYQLGKTLTGFDCILAYSAPWTVIDLGRRLSIYHQKPLFLELGDVWPDVPIGMGIIRNPWLIRWLYKRTRRIYDRAIGIFPYSEGMGEQVAAHGVSPGKIHVIPNGVNPGKVPFSSRARKNNEVHVLYTGTIGVANDLTQLVQAIHQIERTADAPPMRFAILGEGNDANRVKALAKRLGVASLQFLPRVSREEATQLLQEADIGVICFAAHPVLEANGATKFFDYLASGLPIVLNYRGWQSTYLTQYQCGLSSDQGDIQGFVENLATLSRDASLRQSMGHRGRQLAVEKFSRIDLADRMLQCMQATLSTKSSVSPK